MRRCSIFYQKLFSWVTTTAHDVHRNAARWVCEDVNFVCGEESFVVDAALVRCFQLESEHCDKEAVPGMHAAIWAHDVVLMRIGGGAPAPAEAWPGGGPPNFRTPHTQRRDAESERRLVLQKLTA